MKDSYRLLVASTIRPLFFKGTDPAIYTPFATKPIVGAVECPP